MSIDIEQFEEYTLPPRVRAAIEFLHFLHWVRKPNDANQPGRALSPVERAVEQQALQVLSQYFTGEMDFGDRPVRPRSLREGDEGPAPKAPTQWWT